VQVGGSDGCRQRRLARSAVREVVHDRQHFGLVDPVDAVVANALPFEIGHFRFVGEVDPQTGQIIGTPRPMQRTYPLVNTVMDFGQPAPARGAA
jgi:hypothetical protein